MDAVLDSIRHHSSLIDAFVRGSEALGSGHFIFKVGERATVTLRSPILAR
ncbi:MAG: hypothetical protein ACRDJE_13225 [Dehalococcoidia bacterium]